MDRSSPPGPAIDDFELRRVPGLHLSALALRNFRNITAIDLAFAPRLTVVSGPNGHGKTSVLEAVYFLATGRSFRTSKLSELVQHRSTIASVKGAFSDATDAPLRYQVAAIEQGRARLKIDGQRPRSAAQYATRSPVVVFHAEELQLTAGPAQTRRRLLDRVALYLEAASADLRTRYAKALRGRQELLKKRGRQAPVAELDAYEAICADCGAALTQLRARTVERLKPAMADAFRRIAAPNLELGIHYAPGGSPDPDTARERLANDRERDGFRNTAGFGPHRDDLSFMLDDQAVRAVASQGQHRAITLALKSAEAAAIAEIAGAQPILLLDDVSSELDPQRTAALFAFLGATTGQILLTTTRPELIHAEGIGVSDRRDIVLENGAEKPD